jgi:hypothetical protein
MPKLTVNNDVHTLVTSISLVACVFVGVLFYQNLRPKPDAPQPKFIELRADERAALSTQLEQLELQIQKFETGLSHYVRLQDQLYGRLFNALVEVDTRHRLHPHLFAKLGPASNLDRHDVTPAFDAYESTFRLEVMFEHARAGEILDGPATETQLARLQVLRRHLTDVSASRQKMLRRWYQYGEEKAIDEAQLAASDQQLEQKIWEAQMEYDAKWGYGDSAYTISYDENGYIIYDEVQKPPRPQLPKIPDPYERSMSISTEQADLLYFAHKIQGDIIATQMKLTQAILKITALQERIVQIAQLLKTNARPNRT